VGTTAEPEEVEEARLRDIVKEDPGERVKEGGRAEAEVPLPDGGEDNPGPGPDPDPA
jgi:hypothetical protein